MMKYSETIEFMYNALPMFHRQGRSAFKKDLTNIKALCNALNNPQSQLKCIHIAGTNGKGSVSHMLAAVLQANGYKTGLYVSPHYKDFRERIKVNGKYISRSYVCHFIEKNKMLFHEVKPSFFEMTVALAFSYFQDQKVDYAVIETGLGGRLDSTNIIKPLLSIITNISWDHSDILGDSLEKIAVEKAGIIKENTSVLIGRKQPETKNVFKDVSKSVSADLYYADDLIEQYSYSLKPYGVYQIKTKIFGEECFVSPSLKGLYQIENVKTVLGAVDLLKKYTDVSLESNKIVYALEHTIELTRFMGRWQTISEKPLVICESAHNEDGIQFLMKQIGMMKYNTLHIVCGFVKDKPLNSVLTLFPKKAKYYFVNAKLPRALAAADLKNLAAKYDLKGNKYSSVQRGLAFAKKAAGNDDLIVVTGSIFVVAEVL